MTRLALLVVLLLAGCRDSTKDKLIEAQRWVINEQKRQLDSFDALATGSNVERPIVETTHYVPPQPFWCDDRSSASTKMLSAVERCAFSEELDSIARCTVPNAVVSREILRGCRSVYYDVGGDDVPARLRPKFVDGRMMFAVLRSSDSSWFISLFYTSIKEGPRSPGAIAKWCTDNPNWCHPSMRTP